MQERNGEHGDSGGATGSEAFDDSERGRILGTTTVSQGGRISLVTDVRDAFADRGVEIEEGDTIVYWRYGDRIVIEPA